MDRYIGIDAGSVSVKLAVMDARGDVIETNYVRHKGNPLAVAYGLLSALPPGCSLSVTGSAGKLIAKAFGIKPVNEVVALSYSTKKLCPEVRTVIEMGGEDSKLILLDNGLVKEFSMNSVCAAGTGSFLDQQAERLNLSIEEFGEIALRSKTPPRIAGRCSVFAKSDMIHLQQIATPVEDIVAGLCFAVARNFKGIASICKGRVKGGQYILSRRIGLNVDTCGEYVSPAWPVFSQKLLHTHNVFPYRTVGKQNLGIMATQEGYILPKIPFQFIRIHISSAGLYWIKNIHPGFNEVWKDISGGTTAVKKDLHAR